MSAVLSDEECKHFYALLMEYERTINSEIDIVKYRWSDRNEKESYLEHLEYLENMKKRSAHEINLFLEKKGIVRFNPPLCKDKCQKRIEYVPEPFNRFANIDVV